MVYFKTADPANNFDNEPYIEHPDLPSAKRSRATRPDSWSYITAIIGKNDPDAEPEIDTKNMCIPGLFHKQIDPDEINCLTVHQFRRHIDRIDEERVERNDRNQKIAYNKYQRIIKRKKKNTDHLIILAEVKDGSRTA